MSAKEIEKYIRIAAVVAFSLSLILAFVTANEYGLFRGRMFSDIADSDYIVGDTEDVQEAVDNELQKIEDEIEKDSSEEKDDKKEEDTKEEAKDTPDDSKDPSGGENSTTPVEPVKTHEEVLYVIPYQSRGVKTHIHSELSDIQSKYAVFKQLTDDNMNCVISNNGKTIDIDIFNAPVGTVNNLNLYLIVDITSNSKILESPPLYEFNIEIS